MTRLQKSLSAHPKNYLEEPGFEVENYSKELETEVVSDCPSFFSFIVVEL